MYLIIWWKWFSSKFNFDSFTFLYVDFKHVYSYLACCDFSWCGNVLKVDPSSCHLKPDTAQSSHILSFHSVRWGYFIPIFPTRRFRHIITLHCHLYEAFKMPTFSVTSKKATLRLMATSPLCPNKKTFRGEKNGSLSLYIPRCWANIKPLQISDNLSFSRINWQKCGCLSRIDVAAPRNECSL